MTTRYDSPCAYVFETPNAPPNSPCESRASSVVNTSSFDPFNDGPNLAHEIFTLADDITIVPPQEWNGTDVIDLTECSITEAQADAVAAATLVAAKASWSPPSTPVDDNRTGIDAPFKIRESIQYDLTTMGTYIGINSPAERDTAFDIASALNCWLKDTLNDDCCDPPAIYETHPANTMVYQVIKDLVEHIKRAHDLKFFD